MKITIHQTRQIKQFEPRRIEVEIDTDKLPSTVDWTELVKNTIDSIDKILYPEKLIETDETDNNLIDSFKDNNEDNEDRVPF